MAWNLVAPNTWKNDRSDYVIEYDPDYSQYVIRSMDGTYTIPFDDIFNNPVFPIDLSQATVLGKHFRAEGVNTPNTPGFSFQSDANTGFYRISEDTVGFSAGGTKYGQFGIGYGGFTGNIIQAVNSENDYTHIITTTGNWNSDILSAVATSWEISITPKYVNSKTIIQLYLSATISASSNSLFGVSIWRKIGSNPYTQIQIPITDVNGSYEYGLGGNSLYGGFSKLFIDFPNTTDLVKYKFSARLYAGYSGTLGINNTTTPTKGKSFCLIQEVQQ